MNVIKHLNNVFYRFALLEKFPELVHYITTRLGGYSSGVYDSFNLSTNVGDNPENVFFNRRKLASFCSVSFEHLLFMNQVHGENIKIIDDTFNTETQLISLDGYDAAICSSPSFVINILSADCVPVLMYDTRNRIVAAVHAGWKGTVLQLAGKTIRKMVDMYGSRKEDIIVGIGPSIGPESYEVGEEVVEAVNKSFGVNNNLFHPGEKGRVALNLWEANKKILLDAGVLEKNIEISGISTAVNRALFYSHRGEAGRTGRFAAGIMLRGNCL